MLRACWLAGALLVGLALASGCWGATMRYAEDVSSFPNPERGWHKVYDTIYHLNETAPPLTREELEGLRGEGLTLVRKYYMLADYRGKAIPEEFLEGQLVSDLETCREAGFKLIPRFTYTQNLNISKEDATLETVLAHIAQVKPILQEHWDVIAFMDVGFVGYWGEWHSSSHNLVSDSPYPRRLNDASRRIIEAVLDALPAQRMVALRYNWLKMNDLFPEPLTEGEAFSGSAQARIGNHSDSFHHDEYDNDHFISNEWGDQKYTREEQIAYSAQDSKYVIQSGEPWGTEYSIRVSPIAKLERHHWRTMSHNQGDSKELYRHWRESGLYEEIGRRLGYRYRLVWASAPEVVGRGEMFSLKMEMANDGFGGLYNPRAVEVVLRHGVTGDVHRINCEESDARLLLPEGGETKTVTVEGEIPGGLAAGEYAVLLSLPDPAPRLYGDARYSVRLANRGVWEAKTGFNDLGLSVEVR